MTPLGHISKKKALMLQQDPLLQQLCIAFGYAVRAERETQNISQEQLGHMIGSGHARISDIEGGLVACSLEEVVRLCRALDVNPSELLAFEQCTLEACPEPEPKHVFLKQHLRP